MIDYYKILNLNKDATQETIKKEYQKLIKIKHPDKGGNKEEFTNIFEGYKILSDPNKKREYDDKLNNYNNPYSSLQRNNRNRTDINSTIFELFNNFNNMNLSQQINTQTKRSYVYGDVKIEKITIINNGIKKEIIREINLKTGEVKEKIN